MTDQRSSLSDIPHFFAPRSSFAPTCRCGRKRDDPIHLRAGDDDVQHAIDVTGARGRNIAREERGEGRRGVTRSDGAA